ncbi:hypothetical protein GMA12_06995 [Kocuria sediminis]|uniref:Uncharacterized protein n=1 Tax=Kocuria sediminis TaxID=1038857 RepID=A0A6N8GIZ6_9MICC|nr:hypothetical protein [Kocuria sediminis]
MYPPWPDQTATGPFTVTGVTVERTVGDTGTFDLMVIDEQGELTLWLQQPLAEVVPEKSLVQENAQEEEAVGEAMANRFSQDVKLRDAVEQLGLEPPATDTDDGGTDEETAPSPTAAPVQPFTVQPGDKIVLAVRCDIAGSPAGGQCIERVTVSGKHEPTEGGG